ncbi:hypothetical protein Lalb_Chr12g0199211 [Lupinus albus]|uniref:Uncharacterized protein n=1 Tax=Lupinus albus TaxID=3870 RepID=A0A6A4PLK3_LUPAL|nr:hypothetical protein Lalb_Chr12g0199211 [Lupinus albus]
MSVNFRSTINKVVAEIGKKITCLILIPIDSNLMVVTFFGVYFVYGFCIWIWDGICIWLLDEVCMICICSIKEMDKE